MKENKKEVKKEVKKAVSKLKITKLNGNVIYRESYEGLAKQYESKGYKVEEV